MGRSKAEAVLAGATQARQPQGGKTSQRQPGGEQRAGYEDFGGIPALMILLAKLLLEIRHVRFSAEPFLGRSRWCPWKTFHA